MEITYLTQPPKKWTFEMPKLKEWVESWCKGNVLNLFAGKVKLKIDEIRVDISDEFKPDCICDAYDWVISEIGNGFKYDTIILDPRYNLRKAREKYNGKYIGSLTKIKNLLPEILLDGGRVITLGYDTVGMSKSRGFKKIALCVICHNGDHNDTLCLVEERIN